MPSVWTRQFPLEWRSLETAFRGGGVTAPGPGHRPSSRPAGKLPARGQRWLALGLTMGFLWMGTAAAQGEPAAATIVPSSRASATGLGVDVQVARLAPRLDGVPDDLCWRKARWDEFPDKDSGSAASTRFAFVQSDQALFVAVVCSEPRMQDVRSRCSTPDGLFEWFFNDDWIEVLLDPALSGHDYYWLLVNPDGSKTDLWCAADPDRSWNGEWRASTRREEDRWSVEIALPFAGFDRARPEATWAVNVVRMRRPEGGGRSLWGGEHRVPRTWNRIRLARPPHLPAVPDLHLALLPGDTPDTARMTADASNVSDFPFSRAWFRLLYPERMSGLFPHGAGLRSSVAARYDADRQTLDAEIAAQPDEFVVARLVLQGESGDPALVSPDRGCRRIPRLDGPGPRYDAYMIGERLEARWSLGDLLPGDHIDVMLRSEGEQRWHERLRPAESSVLLSISLEGISRGRLELETRYRRGDTLLERRVYPLRYAMRPKGSVVRIDRLHRVLEVDGQPFIAVGNSPGIAHGAGHVRTEIKALADAGFTALHVWGGFLERGEDGKRLPRLGLTRVVDALDRAAEHGMMAFLSIAPLVQNHSRSPFRKLDITDEERLRLLDELVDSLRDHPALLGYESVDEPEFFVDPDWLARVRSRVKARDPFHVVTINNCRGARSCLNYGRATDMIGTDYYPCGKWPVHSMGPLLEEVVDFARYKPAKCWIQGYKIFNPRAPTAAEVKAMSYMALARGVTALFYFIGRPADPALWAAQRECAAEIRQLAPALVRGPPASLPSSTPDDPVHAASFDDGRCIYVLAVNQRDRFADGALRVPACPEGATWDVLFEDRQVPAQRAGILDRFAPFERHVYRYAYGDEVP